MPRTPPRKRCWRSPGASGASTDDPPCPPGSTGSRPTPAWTARRRAPPSRACRARPVAAGQHAPAEVAIPGGSRRGRRGTGDPRRRARQLPEEFRVAVVLRDVADLDYATIAEVTGVAIGTVRSRIARGRDVWPTSSIRELIRTTHRLTHRNHDPARPPATDPARWGADHSEGGRTRP
ncbi:MAG: sigma factor-like helix-turn-helix DNA-binding protein [Microthrixaceae bacterium]